MMLAAPPLARGGGVFWENEQGRERRGSVSRGNNRQDGDVDGRDHDAIMVAPPPPRTRRRRCGSGATSGTVRRPSPTPSSSARLFLPPCHPVFWARPSEDTLPGSPFQTRITAPQETGGGARKDGCYGETSGNNQGREGATLGVSGTAPQRRCCLRLYGAGPLGSSFWFNRVVIVLSFAPFSWRYWSPVAKQSILLLVLHEIFM